MTTKIAKHITHDFLDIARGIAVMMVVAIHSGFMSYNLASDESRSINESTFDVVLYLARFGSAGPMLFFIISGFLMSMLYFEKYEEKLFFKRRIYRIMPMWILFSIIAALGLFSYGNAPDVFTLSGFSALIFNILFLSLFFNKLWDFIPGGWSIQAEMVNYALFHIMKKTKLTYLLLFQLLITLVVFSLEINKVSETILVPLQVINTGAFWFFIGVILSNYLKNKQSLSVLEIVLFCSAFIVTMLTNAPNGISQIQTLFSVCLGILLALLVSKIKFLNSMVIEVGKYSYGIYLIHFVIAQFMVELLVKQGYNINPLAAWAFVICATTLIAYLIAKPLFLFFEKYFINKARQLKGNIE